MDPAAPPPGCRAAPRRDGPGAPSPVPGPPHRADGAASGWGHRRWPGQWGAPAGGWFDDARAGEVGGGTPRRRERASWGRARSRGPAPRRRAAAPGAGRPAGRAGRRHPRARRARGSAARRAPAAHPGRAGPRPGGAGAGPAPADRARRPDRTWCTRSTTGSPRCSPSSGTPGSTPCCSTSGCPRCSWTPTTRGFSYARDADLDMRMDPTTGPTAADVLNTYPVPQLARVLREYGEERFAGRIAAAVDRRRRQAPLRRSAELVELLYARGAGRVPAHRRAPGQAHVPGAADRGQRRAGRAGARHPGRDRRARRWTGGSWCWPTTRWRTASSSASSPSGPARARRSTCPVELPGPRPGAAPAGPRGRAGRPGRDHRQPASRLGAAARRRASPGGSSVRSTSDDDGRDGARAGGPAGRP